jgi:hypothetical protein
MGLYEAFIFPIHTARKIKEIRRVKYTTHTNSNYVVYFTRFIYFIFRAVQRMGLLALIGKRIGFAYTHSV